jgi:hypothetical protein
MDEFGREFLNLIENAATLSSQQQPAAMNNDDLRPTTPRGRSF